MRPKQSLIVIALIAGMLLGFTPTAHAQWWTNWLRRYIPTPIAPTTTPTATSLPTRTPTATRIPTSTATPLSRNEVSTAPMGPPAQKLPAALLVYPLIQAQTTTGGVTQDTRVELLNMSGSPVSLACFYVRSQGWVELGFFVTLTAYQPLSWLASTGTRNIATFTSVPPFDGEGELKCAVEPNSPDLSSYNVVQGRALVFDDTGQSASYSAVAFRRLTPGEYDGVFHLDGQEYERCPDRLHFDVLAVQPGSVSEIILTPCDEDFLNQTPATVTAQVQIINEFEQSFSASLSVTCWARLPLNQVSSTLSRSTLGTDTAHMMVRGAQASLIGLVLDKFTAFGKPAMSGNEPFFEGGRSGTVTYPY